MAFFSLRRKSVPVAHDDARPPGAAARGERRWSLRSGPARRRAAIPPSLMDPTERGDGAGGLLPPGTAASAATEVDGDSVADPARRQPDPTTEPRRGRRPSMTEALKELRGRSRSFSRSLSPKKGPLHEIGFGVVNMVRHPLDVFTADGWRKVAVSKGTSSTSKPSPASGINTDHHEDGGDRQSRSSPVEIPQHRAHVLPPLEMPSSTLTMVEKETLTARPPKTSFLGTAASDVSPTRASCLGVPPTRETSIGQSLSLTLDDELPNPFDDDARVLRELRDAFPDDLSISRMQAFAECKDVATDSQVGDDKTSANQGPDLAGPSLKTADRICSSQRCTETADGTQRPFSRCSTEPDTETFSLPLRLKRSAYLTRPSTDDDGVSLTDVCRNRLVAVTPIATGSEPQKRHGILPLHQTDGHDDVRDDRCDGRNEAGPSQAVASLRGSPSAKPAECFGVRPDDLKVRRDSDLQGLAHESIALRSQTVGSLSRSSARARRPLRFTNSMDVGLRAGPGQGSLPCAHEPHKGSPASKKSISIHEPSKPCSSAGPSTKSGSQPNPSASPCECPWSPFGDAHFVGMAWDAIVYSKTAFKAQICRQGGLHEFWKAAGLALDHAPDPDADGLLPIDADRLITRVESSACSARSGATATAASMSSRPIGDLDSGPAKSVTDEEAGVSRCALEHRQSNGGSSPRGSCTFNDGGIPRLAGTFASDGDAVLRPVQNRTVTTVRGSTESPSPAISRGIQQLAGTVRTFSTSSTAVDPPTSDQEFF